TYGDMPETDPWDPRQYDRFRDERREPFFDLLALVQPRAGMTVIDLGCGTGELTRELHLKLKSKRTIGIDNSAKMLRESASFAADGLTFEQRDITDCGGMGMFDLIFSNAAIQWIADHPRVIEMLSSMLTYTGQLAVQMPANDDHVSHEIAREVASREPFAATLNGWTRPVNVLRPDGYALILHALGFARQHVRMVVYPHVLNDRTEVIEWVRGTMLTDYQKRLPPELWDEFLEEYRAELFLRVPDSRPFFYPFNRILFWAGR
ncbi:MAG: methyltransferase domain-containing protein, partial [Tepidisphaeraceae bacterium]